MTNMVQYSLWPNCQNNCKFCLRIDRDNWKEDKMLKRIKEIRYNIKIVDWKNKYNDGISLMGGEIFFVKDEEVKQAFLSLIDDIIEIVLKPHNSAKISTVTNGMYDPNNLLFPTFDKIKENVGINKADINVSYDIKYRFNTEEKNNNV